MRMDKEHWPGCLLSATYLLEAALGCYSSGVITEWSHPDEYDRVEVASLVQDHPNVWSDCP